MTSDAGYNIKARERIVMTRSLLSFMWVWISSSPSVPRSMPGGGDMRGKPWEPLRLR